MRTHDGHPMICSGSTIRFHDGNATVVDQTPIEVHERLQDVDGLVELTWHGVTAYVSANAVAAITPTFKRAPNLD